MRQSRSSDDQERRNRRRWCVVRVSTYLSSNSGTITVPAAPIAAAVVVFTTT
ncbi:hypothetical protein Hanom_Chr17g01534061 [Helianthus anomalus]